MTKEKTVEAIRAFKDSNGEDVTVSASLTEAGNVNVMVTREGAGVMSGIVVTPKTAQAIHHVLGEVEKTPRVFRANPKK
jgi:hypothetical protein